MPKPWRKRTPDGRVDGDALSGQLRAARDLLQGGRFADGLALLNTLAAAAPGPVRRAQILALAADGQMRRGRFADAAAAYASAGALCWERPHAFLRPALGQVLALLRDVQVAPAAARAREVVDHTVALAAAAAQSAADAQAALAAGAGAQIVIAARPPRPSAIARRFGRLFLAEGEPALAKEFLNRALTLEPNGSAGGRVTLAEITLREGDAIGALDATLTAWRAVQPPKAKMLSAIPLLVRAAVTTGDPARLPAVVSEVSANLAPAKRGVRARGTLLLVRALRSEHRPDLWTSLAAAWLGGADADKVPAVTADLRKLVLSDARIANNAPAAQQAAAATLLTVKGLGPREYLAGAKEQVRATLFLGQTPDVEALLKRGVKAYGAVFTAPLLHGMALAAMMAKKHDLARPLLQRAVAASVAEDAAWGRAVWALARMENVLGHHADAAANYLLVGAQPAVPARFRLKAKLEWAKSLVKAGQPELVAAAAPDILSVLAPVTDWETLLDFARQLRFAPEALKSLREQVFARGEALAEQALAQAGMDPAATLSVLFRLTRRRDDQNRYASIATSWEGMSETRRLWLWTTKAEFWELLAYVYKAYGYTGQQAKAETLAGHYLADPATPPHGAVILGVTRGLRQIENRRFLPALGTFKAAVSKDPNHLLCAHAYYWLALDAWNRNATAEVNANAENIRRCVGPEPSLRFYWELEAKALCLLANLDLSRISPQQVRHPRERFGEHIAQIQSDLVALNR